MTGSRRPAALRAARLFARAAAIAFAVVAGLVADSGPRRPETHAAAARSADAHPARDQRRPGVPAELPRMDFGGRDRDARQGSGLRQGRRDPRRPPPARPDLLARRLGPRRAGDGNADPLEGSRRGGGANDDRQLPRAGARLPRRARPGDRRRRLLRLGLSADPRRRRRTARRSGAAGRRPPDHHGGEGDRRRRTPDDGQEDLRAGARRPGGERPTWARWASAIRSWTSCAKLRPPASAG